MTTTLRWPDGRGGFVDRDPERAPGDVPVRVSPGETVDVDDKDTVDHYLNRGFVRVDSNAADGGADDTAESGGEDTANDDAPADASDAGDEQGEDDFDVEGFVDRTPVSDVVDDIDAGEADGHLQAVKEADGRVTVERAVEDRRKTLGGD